jgi:hypothetical protein
VVQRILLNLWLHREDQTQLGKASDGGTHALHINLNEIFVKGVGAFYLQLQMTFYKRHELQWHFQQYQEHQQFPEEHPQVSNQGTLKMQDFVCKN